MSEDLQGLRERQIEGELRLASLERAMGDVAEDVKKLSRLLLGNGEEGLLGQLRMSHERIEVLQRQYKWVLAILAALLAAAIKIQVVG